MIIARSIAEARKNILRLKNKRSSHEQPASVGFVPTMGYLHHGHGSLLQQARKDNEIVVLSIFVNPLQFGPNEDYETYPRDEEKDLHFAEAAGVDLVFIPSLKDMYPQPIKTKVTVSELTEKLCGASRPGHFDGVTTVVAKLFHIIQPDKAYFGQKDAQQVAVIQQMVRDLSMNIQIVSCPIIRETDGLAFSSRNVYLTEAERRQATVLYHSLQEAQTWIKQQPSLTVGQLRERIIGKIQAQPSAKIDYVEILSYPNLASFENEVRLREIIETESLIIALAVFIGKTRLIDNCIIDRKEGSVRNV